MLAALFRQAMDRASHGGGHNAPLWRERGGQGEQVRSEASQACRPLLERILWPMQVLLESLV